MDASMGLVIFVVGWWLYEIIEIIKAQF